MKSSVLLFTALVLAAAPACSADDASSTGLGEPIELTEFAQAWGSGDPDSVRAFYSPDALIFPIGVDESSDGSLPDAGWNTEDDIDREVAQHSSGTLEVFDPVRVGDIATYTWRWTFPTMTITGADILHYRDDLIWRHFIDYQLG